MTFPSDDLLPPNPFLSLSPKKIETERERLVRLKPELAIWPDLTPLPASKPKPRPKRKRRAHK